MEIDNNRIASLLSQKNAQDTSVEQKTGKEQEASANTGHSRTTSSDRISLTDTAQQMKNLINDIASQPVVDSQRVASIRGAIEEGTFTVNPERIADSLIAMERALTEARL